MHGIPFSHSPNPEDISVFLLPNLCCASKICSWAASRAEKASPRSAEKEGGGAGEEGSNQTAKGVWLKDLGGRQGLPNSRRACWRGPRLPPLPWLASVSPRPVIWEPPGQGPFDPALQWEGTPPPTWPGLFQELRATVFGSWLYNARKMTQQLPHPGWLRPPFSPLARYNGICGPPVRTCGRAPPPSPQKKPPLQGPLTDNSFIMSKHALVRTFLRRLSPRRTHLFSKC